MIPLKDSIRMLGSELRQVKGVPQTSVPREDVEHAFRYTFNELVSSLKRKRALSE